MASILRSLQKYATIASDYNILFIKVLRIMISTNGITMQFGAKPLFENVSVKFGEGNRYGLIGANGSGRTAW